MTSISNFMSHQQARILGVGWLLFICMTTPVVHAQYRTSVQGVVTDSEGAVISGANLTLTDTENNKAVTANSNQSGVFSINGLPPDKFTLTVERTGFAKKVLNNLQFVPEQANSLNIQLTPAATTETVEVDASQAPALNTETPSIGTTVTTGDIQLMPYSNRDIFILSQLAPGAVSDGSQAAGGGVYMTPGNVGYGGSGSGGQEPTENGPQLNANGTQYEYNAILIDGIDTDASDWNGASVITPDPDSVANVQIATNQYDAEVGRFSGAVTQVTTKSGTNQFHGTLFLGIHRPGLNAYQRPYFTLGTASVPIRDNARFNQESGTIGGPIWKNKIFAFFDFASSPNDSVSTGTGWYDTPEFDALARSGSIAGTMLDYPGNSPFHAAPVPNITCASAGLINGTNCEAVPGGLNIGSPLATPLGTHDPTEGGISSDPGVGSGLSDVPDIALYTATSPYTSYYHAFNGRLDADVTQKDHASFMIYWIPQGSTSYGGRQYDEDHHAQRNDALNVIWNHTFSPTFLNQMSVSDSGWHWNDLDDNSETPFGFPEDSVAGLGTIGIDLFGPSVVGEYYTFTYNLQDVATKVLGNHTIKFGGDAAKVGDLNLSTYNYVPNYGFYNIWDFLNDAPMSESADFLPSTGIPGVLREDVRMNEFGFFVQDDWKVRPNLTVNLGLRYSYTGAIYSKQNDDGVVVVGSGTSLLSGIKIRQGGDGWIPQKLNFGPEVGFAWSPEYFHSSLVVRGGFGLSFNGEEFALPVNIAGNPPASYSYTFQYAGPGNPGTNGNDIFYAISSSPTNPYGYPANSNAITPVNTVGLPIVGGVGLSYFPQHTPTQYVEHYSLDIQKAFAQSLIFTLGYEGSESHHTSINEQLNDLGQVLNVPLNPSVTSVTDNLNEGAGNNNALLASLKHQFAHQFQLEGQFMWAKSMDDSSNPYAQEFYTSETYLPLGSHHEYGRSIYDIGKSFKVFGTWQPVIFHGSHSWAEKVAGGWALTGIYTAHSGYGWTPTYNTSQSVYCSLCGATLLRPGIVTKGKTSTGNSAFEKQSNFSNYAAAVAGAQQSAAIVNNVPTVVQYSNQYFDTTDLQSAMTWAAGSSGFPSVNMALPPLPGLGRESSPGPRYEDVDAGLTKSFGLPRLPALGESAELQISADALNLFNNLNFNSQNIVTDVTSPNFGTINSTSSSSALGSRIVSFSAKFRF